MKTILVANSDDKAVVDDGDYEKLAGFKWRLDATYLYAVRSHPRGMEQMAYTILGAPPSGKVWDHIDGNKLNNCRLNLRAATPRQTRQNSRKRRDATCKYKGVSKKPNGYQATISARVFNRGHPRPLLTRYLSMLINLLDILKSKSYHETI